MTDPQQTEHERRVAEEEEEQNAEPVRPDPGGTEDRYTGDAGAESYEAEVEAEREGRAAREDDDDADRLDPPAYRPRSG